MLAQIRKARQEESGFTLIELLIVIVILGILAGIVVFAVSGITDRGKNSACSTSLKTIQTAEEADYAKNGQYDQYAALISGGFMHAPAPDTFTIALVPATGTTAATYTLTGAKGANNDCTGTNG